LSTWTNRAAFYLDVIAEPPDDWEMSTPCFPDWFRTQSRRAGFAMVEAREAAELVDMAFGATRKPAAIWWRNFQEPCR
jgi:hypothetical protein